MRPKTLDHVALWVAEITNDAPSPLSFTFHVWPLDGLLSCTGNIVDGLTTRICANDPSNCNLNVRTDRSTACQESSDGWRCYDNAGALVPAIRTRLMA